MRHMMKSMDLTSKKKSLHELLEMLRRSQAKFRNMGSIQSDKLWEFEQEIKIFLGEFQELKIHEKLCSFTDPRILSQRYTPARSIAEGDHQTPVHLTPGRSPVVQEPPRRVNTLGNQDQLNTVPLRSPGDTGSVVHKAVLQMVNANRDRLETQYSNQTEIETCTITKCINTLLDKKYITKWAFKLLTMKKLVNFVLKYSLYRT